jgi:hypothetical protein
MRRHIPVRAGRGLVLAQKQCRQHVKQRASAKMSEGWRDVVDPVAIEFHATRDRE